VSALERLKNARTALVLDHPYYGSLAVKLRLCEEKDTSKTDTAATDGRSVYFYAPYVDTLSDAEVLGLFAHEVLHPSMQHHTRREGRDPGKWNIAADHEINPVLVADGFTLPPGALLDAAYRGMCAERIFPLLPKDEQGDDQGGGNGERQQPAGGVLDAPDPAVDEAEWKVNVAQAQQIAKMMGHTPCAAQMAVAETIKPRTDWKSLLRRFVQQCASADYSWKMPNRRYINGGLYLPELRSESMPPIVFVIDTSGSTRTFQSMFLAEGQNVADECSPECIYVIESDAEVQRVTRFDRGEPIVLAELQGQGGTDFRPAFEYVEREQIQPACLIYLTDGYGDYPEFPSEYPTLWAMTNDRQAPWGESIRIEEST
jgi:predicted metal-dependent peptidase